MPREPQFIGGFYEFPKLDPASQIILKHSCAVVPTFAVPWRQAFQALGARLLFPLISKTFPRSLNRLAAGLEQFKQG